MRPLPVGDRSRRLLATRPQWRREPWGTNYVTAALLAYALGITDECPTDEAFARAYKPGHTTRADFPTEARHTPLALARVLALRRQGRDAEADALLNGTPAPSAPEPSPAPEPAREEPPVATAEVTTEVIPDALVEDPAPSTATPLPAAFPERDRLTAAGYTTLEAVEAASDTVLRAVNGIGPAKVSLIRAALTRERG